MKVPFFFRTRDEYEEAHNLVEHLNETVRKAIGWDSASYIHLHSKYTVLGENMDHSIPKRKPGTKKYMAMLRANKEKMNRLNIDLEKCLTDAGLELDERVSSPGPNYTGETTEKEIKLKTLTELKSLTSTFDTAFGNGNWRLHSPRHLHKTLANLERAMQATSNQFFFSSVNRWKDGVPVTIVVNAPGIKIDKYLFKMRLRA